MIANFLLGLAQVNSLEVVFWVFFGTFLGIVFGTVPGISTSMGIALMLPITFTLDIYSSVACILGLYIGGTSGGLVTAILVNIPGNASAIATCWDGYPMAQKGEAGKALGVSIFYSFLGGIFSLIFLIAMAEPLARLAVGFGPTEYFALIIFSMTVIASLSGKSMAKGILSAALGMLLNTFGAAPLDGTVRFTFGFHQLDAGFQFLAVLVGVYAVAEILKVAEHADEKNANATCYEYKMRGFGVTWKMFKEQFWNFIRSSVIGVIIGILPGIGSGVSNMVSYTAAKQQSKHPEKFGTGTIDGVIASETANNAGTACELIPLVSLGIPGDAGTAMMLAALMVQGIIPGPLMFRNHLNLVYAIFVLLFISNILVVAIQYFGMRFFLKILQIPKNYLFPTIIVMSIVGAFSANSRAFDVLTVILFAFLGYGMYKFKYSISSLVVGYVLAETFEISLRRSLMVSDGSYLIFLQNPVSAIVLAISLLTVIFIMRGRRKSKDFLLEEGI